VLEVRDVRGEALLGSAVVEHVRPDVAVARWEGAPPDPPQVAFRVRETRRGSAEPPLRVLRAGAEALEELALVRLVSDEERPEYRVAGRGESAVLETLDGIRIGSADRRTVESEIAFRGLRELAAERGQYDLGLAVRAPTEAELAALGAGVEGELATASILSREEGSVVVVGADASSTTRNVVMFEVANESGKRLFVYLLSLEEARARTLIGLEGEDFVVLDPGESCSIPVAVVTRSTWRPARPMLDRYLALAFPRKLQNPGALESRTAITRGRGDELPGVLSRLVRGPLTRGGEPVALSPEGWGIDSLDLLVVPDPQ
jgi:hypothetical protein